MPAAPIKPQCDAILSGNFIKKGEKVKNWKKRLFVLFPSMILYFKEANDLAHPAGVIFLKGAQVTENVEIGPAGPKKKANEISIATSSRDYILISETEEQKKQWLAALTECLNNLSSQKDEKLKKEKFLLDNAITISKSVLEELAKTLNSLGISDRTGDEEIFFEDTALVDDANSAAPQIARVEQNMTFIQELYGQLKAYIEKNSALFPVVEKPKSQENEDPSKGGISSVVITKSDLEKNKDMIKVSEESSDDEEKEKETKSATEQQSVVPTEQTQPESENISSNADNSDFSEKEKMFLKKNSENEARIQELLKQNQELRTKMAEMTTSFDEKENKIKELSQHKRVLIKEVRLLRKTLEEHGIKRDVAKDSAVGETAEKEKPQ